MPRGIYPRTEEHRIKNINNLSHRRKHYPKGANSPVWKGGLPTCKTCGKIISRYTKYKSCYQCWKYSKDNPQWKGGISKDPEYVKKYHHEKYLKNKSRLLVLNKKWKSNNPDKKREYKRRRRNLEANASGHHTEKEWKDLKDKYGNICLCCKKLVPLTEDHIVPLTKGGSDFIENIQPLCGSCNSKKHTNVILFKLPDR